mgnify:FL=1
MFKKIIKRFFEWFAIVIITILSINIIDSNYNNFNWGWISGSLFGYLFCLIVRTPYNKKEIELDEYIDKHNKNGF